MINQNGLMDVVIPTFNRHEKVKELIGQLLPLQAQNRIANIIVVDSSDITLSITSVSSQRISIIRSSHKNQPYQRFLGAKASRADYILYLDDDMEIVDDSFCEELNSWSEKGVAGVNLKFTNDNTFLAKLKKSIVPQKGLPSVIRTLSGYPLIKPNTVWLTGLRGSRISDQEIEYVNGGVFFAKRELLYNNLSFILFDIYDKGLGKGEDTITGYALSCHGKIIAHAKTYFYHNDQGNSVYTRDHYKFSKRVAYSRLFLSFEYARLTGKSSVVAFIHYQWYSFWRIMGLVLNFSLKPGKYQFQRITGYIWGVILATIELTPQYFINDENKRVEYWERQVSSDLQAASSSTLS